jgi:hypothetical protein
MTDRTLTDTATMMTIRTGKLRLFQPLAGELESEEEEEEEPSPLPVVDEVEELEPSVAIGPTVMGCRGCRLTGTRLVAAQHYSGYISSFLFSVAIAFSAGAVSAVQLPTGRVAKCILHYVAAAAWIGLEDEGAQTRRYRADSEFQGDVCCRCARYGACIVGIEV